MAKKVKKLIKKAKRAKANFKAGYSAGRHPTLHKLSSAFDTVTNVGGAALSTGPIGATTALGFTGLQVAGMAQRRSKAGKLGKKVGSKVLSAKQKVALRKAQLASAKKRAMKKVKR